MEMGIDMVDITIIEDCSVLMRTALTEWERDMSLCM